MKKLVIILFGVLWTFTASAQWQVPTNSIPYGRGQGVVGFGSITNTGSGTKCLTDTIPPTFQTCGGGGGSGTVTSVGSGTGLSGGPITGAGTLSVLYGTASGTAAQGNDSRILGALQAASNLADLTDAAAARTSLGLGTMAIQNRTAVDIAGGVLNGTLGATTPASVAATTIAASTSVALTRNFAGATQVTVSNNNAAGRVELDLVGPTLYGQIIQNADSNTRILTVTPSLLLDAVNASGAIDLRTGVSATSRLNVSSTGGITIAGLAGTSGCVVNDSTGLLSSSACGSSDTVPGMVCDGVTNTASVLNSYISAQGANTAIKLPKGICIVGSVVNCTAAGQSIIGQGADVTTLKNTSTGTSVIIDCDTHNGFVVKDLTIDVDSKGTNFCIRIKGSQNSKILNVNCKNATNGGFSFEQNGSSVGSHYSVMSNLYLENIANVAATNAHAIECSLSNYTSYTNITMQNVDNGFNIAACSYASIAGASINGSGLTNSGFAGIRCADETYSMSASAVSMFQVPRGLFLIGCNFSSFSAISIVNTQYQPVLINATNVPGAPTSAPTQGNVLTGITVRNGCQSAACSLAFEFAISGVAANQVTNNVIVASNFVKQAGSITTTFGLTGVTAGLNRCDTTTNLSNVTFGSC